MGWKHMTYIINSNPGHRRSKQYLDKNLKTNFIRPSGSTRQKKKEKKRKKERQLQSVLRYTQTEKYD